MGTAKLHRVMAAVVVALGMALCAQGASAADKAALPTPDKAWGAAKKQWESVQTYSTDLFAWNYKTQSSISNFPEHRNKEGKPDNPDWAYRVYNLRFKKPNKAIVLYALSTNEKTDEGSIIDRAVAYVLTYVSDTALIYGVQDPKLIYIVFPYISTKQFSEMPIGLQWKAAMKLLMYASRGEVYWKKIEDMKDPRGSMITDLNIGSMMKRFEHYFKDGKVTLSESPAYTREDFNCTKDGWVTLKSGITKPNTVYKLTMVPNNLKANRNISKTEVFLDPKTNMFTGLMEYENGKLVQVFLFQNLKINPDLPDKLWTDYFKGRKLSDKK